MEEVEKSAGSVEEAIEAALEELGVSEQEARIQIVQEPKSGFLGIASQPAIVRVAREVARQAGGGGGEPGAEALDQAPEAQIDLVEEFLEGLLDAMGLDADIESNSVDGVTYVEIWSEDAPDDMGLLIGKHGRTLEALQELVRVYVHRETQDRCRVQVDVEDYRKRRRSQIVRRAREAARKVRKSGRAESLEPMTSYERKLVHDAVAEIGGLESVSEGEEPNRRVVIRRKR